jgi:hypothetical protein
MTIRRVLGTWVALVGLSVSGCGASSASSVAADAKDGASPPVTSNEGGPSPDAGGLSGDDAGVAVDGASSLSPDAPGVGDAGTASLPLGTVTVTAPSVTCTGNPGAGSTCMTISVSCPGIADIDATVAVAEPTGTPIGTIVAHAGGAGTGYFNGSSAGAGFTASYTANHFRFVQIAWASDWAQSGVGIKEAACRPATAFHWMFEQIHGGSHTSPFCGTGSSGGSAAIMNSMAHYGLEETFDYLVVAAGPAPARIDYGCEPSLYTGPALNLCPLLTNAPYAYVPGVASIADSWEGTSTCGQTSPPAANVAKWASDSVWSPGGDYDYPQTGISYWFCVTTPNETTGQGKFLIDQLHPKNDPLDVHCYSGICQSEQVFEDPTAFSDAVSEMTTNCVPNH